MSHVKEQRPSGKGLFGLRIIGALKLVGAALLAAAGFGIFRLLDKDLGEIFEHFVKSLHLDPDNWYIHETIGQLSSVEQSRLQAIGAGTFFYALMELVEGIGLILRRVWASYFTVAATALLLLPEGYDLSRETNVYRIAVLLVNLVIVGYLVYQLRREHLDRASSTAD